MNVDETWMLVVGGIALAVLVVVALGAFVVARRRRARRRNLEEHFGPEYDTMVDELGRRRAHDALEQRLEEHAEMDLERVRPAERDDFSEEWRTLQHRFVETPEWSVREAEHLVVEVMRERGLPVDDVGSRVSALSVVDGDLATRYRDAYETFRAMEDGDDDVGRMHGAMVAYRDVFETLLDRPRREASVVGDDPPTD